MPPQHSCSKCGSTNICRIYDRQYTDVRDRETNTWKTVVITDWKSDMKVICYDCNHTEDANIETHREDAVSN